MRQYNATGLRKYVEVDLKRYIDPDTINELQNAYFSQKAGKYMQCIFHNLILEVQSKEQKIEELQDKIDELHSSLLRQQRHVMHANHALGQSDNNEIYYLGEAKCVKI